MERAAICSPFELHFLEECDPEPRGNIVGNSFGVGQGQQERVKGQTADKTPVPSHGVWQGSGVWIQVLPVPSGLCIPRTPSLPFLSTKLQAALKNIWGVCVGLSPAPSLSSAPTPQGPDGEIIFMSENLEFQGHSQAPDSSNFICYPYGGRWSF